MNKIGFIGLGHMGGVLLKHLLNQKGINSKDVVIYNRTTAKADFFKEKYPDISVVLEFKDMLSQVDTIISCVHAQNQKDILELLYGTEIHFISASNKLSIETMESWYSGKITRIMPTVALGGYTLLCPNSKVSTSERLALHKLFSFISEPMFVKESDFGILTLLTSCGPGLYSALLDVISTSFSENTDLPKETISDVLNKTLLSTVQQLSFETITYKELINTVATKGGLTEVGVNIIQKQFPDIINNVIDKSLEFNNKP
ncbi:MAG: NAD(P)-binding domain-containing protein [Spirochaetaceae bacterium]